MEEVRDKRQYYYQAFEDFYASRRSGCGCGMFDGIFAAADHANRVTMSQRRRYRWKGIVPRPFLDFLKYMGVLPEDYKDSKPITFGKLACLLQDPGFPYEDNKAKSAGQFIARSLLKDSLPLLNNNSFAITSKVWNTIPRKKRGVKMGNEMKS